MSQGRTKERHNAIAHDLVHRPFIAMHGVHHAFQHRIEELASLFRVALSQQFHGAFEVRKQHRDLLALAFQRTAGDEDFLREIRRGVGEGGQRGCPGWRCGRRRRPHRIGPDEDPALLIHRQALAVDDLIFEVIQRSVVQLALPLQGPIRQAAPLAQQRDHLIHDGDKIHRLSSHSGVVPGCACALSS
jgi:hypothetical protein